MDVQNRDPGLLKKAISKISTEYRLQFAWPQGHTSRRDIVDSSTPRKSQSMGALKPAANAMVHKKRTDLENKDGNVKYNKALPISSNFHISASELEPLVNDKTIHEEDNVKTEYKKNFRPFSQYEYYGGKFTKRDVPNNICDDAKINLLDGNTTNSEPWYREVVELRKKAGEYKVSAFVLFAAI